MKIYTTVNDIVLLKIWNQNLTKSVFTYKCIGSTKYKAVNIFEETPRNRIKIVRKFQGKTIQNIRNFQEKALSFFQPKILMKKIVELNEEPTDFDET